MAFYHVTKRKQSLEFSDDFIQPQYFTKTNYRQGRRPGTHMSCFAASCPVCSPPVSLEPGLGSQTPGLHRKSASWGLPDFARVFFFLSLSVLQFLRLSNGDDTDNNTCLGWLLAGLLCTSQSVWYVVGVTSILTVNITSSFHTGRIPFYVGKSRTHVGSVFVVSLAGLWVAPSA